MKRLAWLALLFPTLAGAQGVPPPNAVPPAQTLTGSTLDALGKVTEIKKNMHAVPVLADSVSGGHYSGALRNMGKAFKGADLAVDLTKGYYRDGGAGFNAAVDEAWMGAKISAGMQVTSGVVAGYFGAPLAPIVAAGGAGVAIGSTVNAIWGDDITKTGYKAIDWGYAQYDKHLLEPRRQEMYDRLRAQHQQAKAQYAAQAASVASPSLQAPIMMPADSPGATADVVGAIQQGFQSYQNQKQQQFQAQQQAEQARHSAAIAAQNAQLQAQMQAQQQNAMYQQQQLALQQAHIQQQQQYQQQYQQQQQRQQPAPAPQKENPTVSSGIHQPDSFCPVPHKPGVCPVKKK